jgi:hypothetical protein
VLHRRVDILELRIAIWMGAAFLRLAVALQAIPGIFQQIAYRPGTDAMPLASRSARLGHTKSAGHARSRIRHAGDFWQVLDDALTFAFKAAKAELKPDERAK